METENNNTSTTIDPIKSPETAYRVGIDAGSKTIKVVVLDANDEIIYSVYRRHLSNIHETLADLIHDMHWKLGDLTVQLAVTGSAGIGISKLFEIPFTQEVIATTEAIRQRIPHADAIIELGGEDAKVIYLSDGVEQRMNATCAGGTGGFIDTIAFMLGARTADMSMLALSAQRIYPIASRCAVFAQTDIRPLLNQGASRADIAASALDAVVRQTLGGLACGRPIRGTVVFLGGPFEHIPELVGRFRRALELDHKTGIKPKDAHLYPALGAALSMSEEATSTLQSPLLSLKELAEKLDDDSTTLEDESLPRLPPLFRDDVELAHFNKRHAQATFPTKRLFDAEGPLYAGIDSGSTAVKLALLDAEGNLLYSDVQPSRGKTDETVHAMLTALYAAIPSSAPHGHQVPYLAHVTATGYGEELLIKGFGADSGVVETAAHVRAARHLCPDVTFILDIGGQDMKALWLNNGHLSDAVLNEACSSGCGAFIEGTAHGLRTSLHAFTSAALRSTAPVDLGTRCTVFMSSRVKHAQKAGASLEDIAGGVAYSVVQNALFRIIGQERIDSLGEHIVVQGGTFMSDAVLRAFELTCGIDVIRPDRANLMGAIGAALIAQDRSQGNPDAQSNISRQSLTVRSKPQRHTITCEGCTNNCRLSLLDMSNGTRLVSGNRCPSGIASAQQWQPRRRPYEIQEEAPVKTLALGSGQATTATPPNIIALEQELLKQCAATHSQSNTRREALTIGLLDALEAYRFAPFWSKLLASLGFTVIFPQADIPAATLARAWETVPAESVCYPAKRSHAKALDLIERGADLIFFPTATRGDHCAVSCGYAQALHDSIAPLRTGQIPFLFPELSSTHPPRIYQNDADHHALFEALAPSCETTGTPLTPEELQSALDQAVVAQRLFEETLQKRTDEALQQLKENPDAHGILLIGRPYHVDPSVMHDIDHMLTQLGFTVFGATGLDHRFKRRAHRQEGLPEWRPAKRLLRAADFVVRHPQIDLVCLQSFGCGYDAASLEEVRELLEAHGRPFTALKVDEMVETAHIRIRLRTLAESIKATRASAKPIPTADESVPTKIINRAHVLSTPLDEQDLALARIHTVKDACFSANVLAARAIRLLTDDPTIDELILPDACKDCLNNAIPRMIERACGLTPRITWEDALYENDRPTPQSIQTAETADDTDSSTSYTTQNANKEKQPYIGIIGNPLLVFEPFMNDGIIALLEDLGCKVALPTERALYDEDVRYLDELTRFAAQGIDHVIYLQSFGCVKGHVHARGSHYLFAKMFPQMPITVIDFDPEASALNRENRIRLIVESTRRKHAPA